MRRKFKIIFLIYVSLCLLSLAACSHSKSVERVVIYSSSEAVRTERLQKELTEKFTDYEIIVEAIPTGENMAKILAEGTQTECDILFDIDQSFLDSLIDKNLLESLDDFDMSIFAPDFQRHSKEYVPWSRFSGCIVIDKDLFNEKNLNVPHSWEELLNDDYSGLIVMPNPKTSGLGYAFLKLLVNSMGEEKAYNYFNELSKNVLQFTPTGGGPINALIQKEAGISLGLTYQTAFNIEQGRNWEILFFEGGAPHSSTSNAIIKGHLNYPVQTVFDYLYSNFIYIDAKEYQPEHGLKTMIYQGYYPDVIYGNMENNTLEEKNRLLTLWEH